MSSHWHTFPQPNGAETPSIPISLGRLFQGLKHSTNSLLLGGTRQMQVIWHIPFVLFICLLFSAISKTYPEAKSNRELTPWLQACCPSTWCPCSNEISSLLFLMIIFLIFLGPCQKGHGTLRIVGVAATPLFRRASTRFSSYIFSLLSPQLVMPDGCHFLNLFLPGISAHSKGAPTWHGHQVLTYMVPPDLLDSLSNTILNLI